MAALLTYYGDADHVTGKAAEALVGGRLLKIAATRADGENINVKYADAGDPVFGVAGHDTANGALVHVVRSGIVGLLASEAIDAGEAVMVAADGKIAVATATTGKVASISGSPETDVAVTLTPGGVVIGHAVADIANGAIGPVALNI